MWPNFFTGFPFPSIGRANFNTLPTVAVTVGTENVTLELPNHAFRNRESNKLFIINRLSVIFCHWYHTVKIFNSFLSPIEGFFYVFVIPTNSVFKLKNPPIFNKIV